MLTSWSTKHNWLVNMWIEMKSVLLNFKQLLCDRDQLCAAEKRSEVEMSLLRESLKFNRERIQNSFALLSMLRTEDVLCPYQMSTPEWDVLPIHCFESSLSLLTAFSLNWRTVSTNFNLDIYLPDSSFHSRRDHPAGRCSWNRRWVEDLMNEKRTSVHESMSTLQPSYHHWVLHRCPSMEMLLPSCSSESDRIVVLTPPLLMLKISKDSKRCCFWNIRCCISVDNNWVSRLRDIICCCCKESIDDLSFVGAMMANLVWKYNKKVWD